MPVVVVVCSIDPLSRSACSLTLGCDLPGGASLGYDLHADGLHRTLSDSGGRLHSQVVLDLDHDCVDCTLRADLVALLTGHDSVGDPLADLTGAALVITLPVATAPAPAVDAFELAGRGAPDAVVALVDGDTLIWDLLGDDLLDERGLAFGPTDRRAVGEVLAGQLLHAGVVVASRPLSPSAATLVAHVAAPAARVTGLDDLHLTSRAAGVVTEADRARRGRLLDAAPSGAPDGHDVWTLDLTSERPFHPARLHEALPILGGGPVRGRGHFWLPTRLGTACGWDSAGGQLSIGALGPWRSRTPSTRLVVTGIDGDPDLLREAFTHALVTAAEQRDTWLPADGFDPWLGAPHPAWEAN